MHLSAEDQGRAAGWSCLRLPPSLGVEMTSAAHNPEEVIARLMKAEETNDWCELKPEECRALLVRIGELQLYGLQAAADKARHVR